MPQTLLHWLVFSGFSEIFGRDLKYQIIFVLLLHCDLPRPQIHSLLREEKAYIAQLA